MKKPTTKSQILNSSPHPHPLSQWERGEKIKHWYNSNGVRVVCIFLLFTFYFYSPVFAMGEAPVQKELVQPTVSYVEQFGVAGTGDRQFHYPADIKVAVQGDLETGLGHLFVADTGNNRIQRLDEDGGFIYQFGGFGVEARKLNTPVGLAVEFNFRIYVSEKDNDRIQLFDIRGNYLGPVATGEINNRSLFDPAGMDVDSLGNLYVADSGNDRILKFDETGIFLQEIGGFGVGPGFLNQPLDVAVDRDRYIYVADTGNNRVQKFDIDGRLMKIIDKTEDGLGQLSKPAAIAVDDSFVYVSDSGNDRLVVFTKEGKYVLAFGVRGAGPGEFKSPGGISLGKKGKLYIADTGNQRIQVLKISY